MLCWLKATEFASHGSRSSDWKSVSIIPKLYSFGFPCPVINLGYKSLQYCSNACALAFAKYCCVLIESNGSLSSTSQLWVVRNNKPPNNIIDFFMLLCLFLECYVDTKWIRTGERVNTTVVVNFQVTVIVTSAYSIRIEVFVQSCSFPKILTAYEHF